MSCHGASDFTVQEIGLVRSTGISTAINRRVSWYANYDVQFGRGGLLSNLLLGEFVSNLIDQVSTINHCPAISPALAFLDFP